MSNKYYVTTPIYYPSGKLHIGHTYTTVAADAIARYKRLQGYDVFFLTGTDEHGQKIERKAREAGKEPREYVDEIVNWIIKLWQRFHISYDHFIRTTDREHIKGVQEIFRRLQDKGDIYKDKYAGWYCVPCETFWIERQLVEKKCPDCNRDVEWTEEESYFFRLSNYADELLDYIEKNPDFIQPESRRNEMVNFIKQGLEDLCISRTILEWGVPLPGAPGHVAYVWIDALSNYLTGIGFPESDYNRYWPADLHLVGKEIMRFHTIIWPIMLLALDLPLPRQVFGHGWLVLGEVKMSKSLGNVIDPFALADEFGVDAIRYYLLREVAFGADGNYSLPALVKRINSDLANDLGNLLHRTLTMIEKYFAGVIPEPAEKGEYDEDLKENALAAVGEVEKNLEKLYFHQGLEVLWQFIRRSNKYIDETTPWLLARDEGQRERLQTVLYNLSQSLYVIALTLRPFLPETSPAILQQLGLDKEKVNLPWNAAREWGGLSAGLKVKKDKPLFPRRDPKEYAERPKDEEASLPQKKKTVSFDEFKNLDLRVAEVKEAENIEGSDKLLKLIVDDGQGERQVVAGLARSYEPEEIKGKKVVFLANLQPAKIFGVQSQGMVLAAEDRDGFKVLEVEGVAAGSPIS